MTDEKSKAQLAPPPFSLNSRDVRLFNEILEDVSDLPDLISKQDLIKSLRLKRAEAMMRFQAEFEASMEQTFPTIVNHGMDAPSKNKLEIIRSRSLLNGEHIRMKRMFIALAKAARDVPEELCGEDRENAITSAQEAVLYNIYMDKYNFHNRNPDEIRKLAKDAIENVQTAIEQLAKENLPTNHRPRMRFSEQVMTARDVPRLLRLAREPKGKGVISKRISFEARLVLSLMQLEFEHLINIRNPSYIDKTRTRLLKKFDEHVFDNSTSKSVVVVAQLDPDNYYRVKVNPDGTHAIRWMMEDAEDELPKTNEVVFVEHLYVRSIKINSREILVFFDSRRKERIFAKQIRKLQRDVDQVMDLSGLICVLLNEDPEEEEILANKLRANIVNAPGCVKAQASNAKRAGAIDDGNPHSSHDRRGEKYEFMWGGMWHELQILQLPYYINSKVARRGDCHAFYKLTTYLDTLFPWLWPTRLYGLDWNQQSVRDMLWQHQIRVNQAA